jgi:hypothetical protein
LVSPTRCTIVAGGHTGTGAQVLTSGGNNGIIKYTIPSGSRSADIVVGFWWKLDDFNNTPTIISFYGDGDSTQHNRVIVGDTAGALYFTLGTSTIAFGAAGAVVVNTWHYIEVAIRLADSPNGLFTVRVDGTPVLVNGAGTDTKNGGTATVYDTIRLGPNATFGSPTAVYDDLYDNRDAQFRCPGDGLRAAHVLPSNVRVPMVQQRLGADLEQHRRPGVGSTSGDLSAGRDTGHDHLGRTRSEPRRHVDHQTF